MEQNYLQNKMNAEKQVRNEFLTMILRERWERNELYFQNQLKLNNMDIQQRYFVCCASIKGDCFIEEKKRNRTETAILQYERAISNMTSEFQMMVFPHKPIVVYQASMLALLLPEAEQEQFCRGILKSLTAPPNEIWLHTLDTFFQTNRNTSLTSEKLFIHRNTLLFRLKKVQHITGLAPQSFADSVRLYTALSLWKCRTSRECSRQGNIL